MTKDAKIMIFSANSDVAREIHMFLSYKGIQATFIEDYYTITSLPLILAEDIKKVSPDILIMDYIIMGQNTALEVVDALGKSTPPNTIVYCLFDDHAKKCEEKGVKFCKPGLTGLNIKELVDMVKESLEN